MIIIWKSSRVKFPLPLRVTPPLVPLTGMAYVPGVTLLAMFTVRVDVADPFAGGVTLGGLKLAHVIPAGMGVPQFRATVPVNPLTLVTVTVSWAVVEPEFAVAEVTLTVKSCTVTLALAVALSTVALALAVGVAVAVKVAVAVPFG